MHYYLLIPHTAQSLGCSVGGFSQDWCRSRCPFNENTETETLNVVTDKLVIIMVTAHKCIVHILLTVVVTSEKYKNKSMVFLAGAARSHTLMSTIYFNRWDNTCTVLWEIHYEQYSPMVWPYAIFRYTTPGIRQLPGALQWWNCDDKHT